MRVVRAMVLMVLAAMPLELFACTEEAPPAGGDLPGDRGGTGVETPTPEAGSDRDAGVGDSAATDADAQGEGG